MSDRLDQLRRQRALVQEQLAWLDREIAGAEVRAGQQSASAIPASARAAEKVTAPASDAASLSTGTNSGDEEDLIGRYGVGPETVRNDVRKGCFIYFAAALVLFAAGVAVLYFTLRSR